MAGAGGVLVLTALVGVALLLLRLGTDGRPPSWLGHAHGLGAVAGGGLLMAAAATGEGEPWRPILGLIAVLGASALGVEARRAGRLDPRRARSSAARHAGAAFLALVLVVVLVATGT